MAKVYFISDIHLGLGDKKSDREKEELLISFLDTIRSDAEKLFIVGDLFDYWFEYRMVIPKGYHRLLTKLSELVDQGVEISYLMGNHDFSHRRFFTDELGVRMFQDAISISLDSKKFFITHGDGLAEKDLGYRILKRVCRNPLNQWLYSLLHPDLGIALAKSSSRKSRGYTSHRDYGPSDGMRAFAELKIKEGFDYVIMGHRHQPTYQNVGNGYYVNLGDWINHFTYAVFDGGHLTLKQLQPLKMTAQDWRPK